MTKRKRESASSSKSSTADLNGHVDRDPKRRRLEMGTNSSRDTSPKLQKKPRRKGQGKHVSQDLLGQDAIDPELLGEQPGSSNRCEINRSLMRANGFKIRRYDKPTKPSKGFQSFFATRRQRMNILRKDKESWSEEDTAFVLSGKKMAEPGARLGAEFVAKCLLDVGNTISLISKRTVH